MSRNTQTEGEGLSFAYNRGHCRYLLLDVIISEFQNKIYNNLKK